MMGRVNYPNNVKSGYSVLLLDEGFMGTVYTALAIKDAGLEVTVLTANGGKGRYTEPNLTWAMVPPFTSCEYMQVLDGVVERMSFTHIVPQTEPVYYHLWDAEPEWQDKIYPDTTIEQRRLLRDKFYMAKYVASHGISIPNQTLVDSEEDVRAGIEALSLPVVIKGVRGRGGIATKIAATVDDALAAVRSIRNIDLECVLQEYIDGSTYLVGGLFHEGRPIRLYAAEKTAQHPPRTGPSICLRSVHDDALIEPALRVFHELRWNGIASLDFVCRQDGTYLFLEVNPRPWGSIAALESAGVDLFSPFAALLCGEVPKADLAFRTGVEFTVFPLYLISRAHWKNKDVFRKIFNDLSGPQGRPWRKPGLALHLLHRLYWVKKNWSYV